MWLLIPIVLLAALLFVAVTVREFWLGTALLSAAKSLHGRGDSHAAERVLQAIIKRRGPVSGSAKAPAQFLLAGIQLEQGRGQDAAATCRTLLNERMKKGFRTLVRLRLADGLELAGELDEAKREREAAGAPTGNDAIGRMARAQSAMAEGRFAEAAMELDEAIRSLPKRETKVRSVLMARCAHAYLEAGKIDKAIKMCNEAIAINGDALTSITAYGEQAVMLGLVGRLDEAEVSIVKAIEFAVQFHETEQQAILTAVHAEILRRSGRIQEGYRLSITAAEMTIKNRRTVRMAEFECLRSLGRFEEAGRVLVEAERYSGGMTPQQQRRSDAVLTLGKALLECEKGDGSAAMQWLDRVDIPLPIDPRIQIAHEAIIAWAEALSGEIDQSRDRVRQIIERLVLDCPPPSVYASTLFRLSRILLIGDAPEEAKRLADMALSATPDPIDLPGIHYTQGEALFASGELDKARECWHQAVSVSFEAPFIRQASIRIAETEDKNEESRPGTTFPVAN